MRVPDHIRRERDALPAEILASSQLASAKIAEIQARMAADIEFGAVALLSDQRSISRLRACLALGASICERMGITPAELQSCGKGRERAAPRRSTPTLLRNIGA